MANASVLPVGVVVPTLNAMPHLPPHVGRIRELAPCVEEIIVVDSHSTDGTTEYLREHLNLPNVRHLSHPPGLYASWNFGLAQLRAKYAYMATVGDCVPLTSLEEMVSLAEGHRADVLLTPPKLITERGEVSERRWPIHDYIEKHRLTAPAEIPGWKAFAWSALNVPAGLLGSSASNLYRTEVMQKHPFPTTFGYHGDTAWLLENAPELRVVVAPQITSQFLVHASANRARSSGDTPRRVLLSRLARAKWREVLPGGVPANYPPWCGNDLEQFWQKMEAWLAARVEYRNRRANGLLGWLDPRMWQARIAVARHMKDTRLIARETLERLWNSQV